MMVNGLNNNNARRPRRHDDIASIRFLLEETLNFPSEQIIQRRHESSHFLFEERDIRKSSTFVGIFPLIQRIFVLLVFVVFLIILSLVEYFLFYKLIMPGLHSSETLYFDYTHLGIQTRNEIATKYVDSTCERNTTKIDSFSSPFSKLHLSKKESEKYQQLMDTAPIATVDLFANHQSWQHSIPDVVPRFKTRKHILTKGVPHYIEVLLDLPESDLNRQKIGMFSVLVELESGSREINSHYKNNKRKLLATSTRTARIPFESLWISIFRKVICIVPHMIGVIQESRRIVIPSYRYFVESAEFPLRYVTVRLLMSPKKAQRGELVEVVKASLNIGKELTDVQLVLKEWFFTCLTFGTIILFFFKIVLIFAIHCFWKYNRQQQRIILEDDASDILGLDGIDNTGDGLDGRSSRNNSPINESYDENETRSSQGRNNDRYFLDEQGEWEDLPQSRPTGTQTSSQAPLRTDANTSYNDDNIETESNENSSIPSQDETRHTIPN